MDISERLELLVARDFQGSLRAAAGAWRVSQSTLHRLIKGQHMNEGERGLRGRPPSRRKRAPKRSQPPIPRMDQLYKIARFYETTVDALLGGPGDPLAYLEPYAVKRSWYETVATLELPAPVAHALRGMPFSISCAYHALCTWGLGIYPPTQNRREGNLPDLTALWRAQSEEAKAWTTLIEGLVASFGRERVRAKLAGEIERVRLGFQPFAMTLFEKTIVIPDDLGRLYEWFRPTPSGPVHGSGGPTTLFTGLPLVPPLLAGQSGVSN